MDAKTVFEDFIFGRIIPEIKTVVEAARVERGKKGETYGQVLCTLGLLVHTEFVGRLYPTSRRKDGNQSCFDRHFRKMGPGYKKVLDGGNKVYEVLRHGMAHRYFANKPIKLVFFSDSDTSFDVFGEPVQRKTLTAGVGVAKNGHYYFVIDRYLEDFERACKDLYAKYQTTPPPTYPAIMASLSEWVST